MKGEALVPVLLLLALGSLGSAKPPAPLQPGKRMTLAQLRSLAAAVGFADPVTAAAIAMAESGGDPCAQGDPNTGVRSCTPNGTSTSFGLWQVHVAGAIHAQYDPLRLLEAEYNARAALAISRGGADFTPWTTYTSGLYKRFMT